MTIRSTLKRPLVAICLVTPLASAAPVAPAYSAPAADVTTDGLYAGAGFVAAGETREFVIAGRGGVPATGASAVALNVTITNSTEPGFVTVWPTGVARPTASNLNFEAGQTVPNMVIVMVGDSGSISLYNSSGTLDLVVDVLGWFPAGAGYTPLTPARLADSRPAGATIDTQARDTGRIDAGGVADLPVLGRGGVPPDGVGAVALNVTVVGPTEASYLTVWPAGVDRPTASNLNFAADQTVPNMVIVKVGADGAVSMYNAAGDTDVVVDVLGWFPASGSYVGVDPARLLDTRLGSSTIDATFGGGGRLGAGASTTLPVAGRGDVPMTGAGAVALNVTVTGPTHASFLTVWPTGVDRPNSSNLNFGPDETVPNMVIVALGSDGTISLFNNSGEIDVVVDVLGWFPTGVAYDGLTPQRVMDTRGDPTSLPNLPPVRGIPTAYQIVYAVPSDVVPVAGREAALAYTAAAVQRWFDLQTGGRHPLLVRDGSDASVITVVLPYTEAEILAMGSATTGCATNCELTPIVAAIRAAAPATISQGLIIELDGHVARHTCGYSRESTHVMLIPMANCNMYPDTIGVFPVTGGSLVMAHEIAHNLGAVASCAPHDAGDGHTIGDNRDILDAGYSGRDLEHIMLDPGHDDYYLTGRTDCPDIARNPLLGTG